LVFVTKTALLARALNETGVAKNNDLRNAHRNILEIVKDKCRLLLAIDRKWRMGF